MPFVKLDCGIIHSSLWAESSDTRICWITLLVMADATGMVRAVSSAIAREAGVSAEAARKALDLFQSPDDESRSPENKGKRIERVEGGFRVLNYEKYRERDYTGAKRQKRHREKLKRNAVTPVTSRVTTVTDRYVTLPVTQAEAEAYKEKKEEKKVAKESRPTSVSVEDFLRELETDETYRGIPIRIEFGKMVAWCKVHGKEATKRRFVNWINRADKPLPAQPKRPAPFYPKLPPKREVSDQEFGQARNIARQEMESLRQKLRG